MCIAEVWILESGSSTKLQFISKSTANSGSVFLQNISHNRLYLTKWKCIYFMVNASCNADTATKIINIKY